MRMTWKSAGKSMTSLLAVLVLALGVTACGKKNSPKPPSGEDAPYPGVYPTE